jgi:hypothetical protein
VVGVFVIEYQENAAVFGRPKFESIPGAFVHRFVFGQDHGPESAVVDFPEIVEPGARKTVAGINAPRFPGPAGLLQYRFAAGIFRLGEIMGGGLPGFYNNRQTGKKNDQKYTFHALFFPAYFGTVLGLSRS